MTAPTPAELDAQLIAAARQLAVLEQTSPRDPDAIDASKASLLALRQERYPDG